MRLADFLIALLEAHAETLKRLAALFGEDNLVQLLEMAGDDKAARPPEYEVHAQIFELPSPSRPQTDPYTAIEGAVRELDLPAVLLFHLWTYPHYRAYIESPLDLDSRLPGPGCDSGAILHRGGRRTGRSLGKLASNEFARL